ncbi:hypothetical protein PBK173_000524100, partial [Plasmodium berghei]
MCYYKKKAQTQNKYHPYNINPYEYKKNGIQNYLYNVKNNIIYKPNYFENNFKKVKISNILSGNIEFNDISWINNTGHFSSINDENVNYFLDTSLAFYSSSLEPDYDLINNINDKKKV